MNHIENKARKMIVAHLGVEESKITRMASFENDLGADSLDLVEIVMNAEDTFGIQIHDHETKGVSTFGDLVDLVKRKML